MANVFAGGSVYNGSFPANRLRLVIAGVAARGFILQDTGFNFAQQVALLYEVGSNNAYFIGGRSQGQAQVGQVVGPTLFGAALIQRYGDMCTPQDLSLAMGTDCRRAPQAGPASATPVVGVQAAAVTAAQNAAAAAAGGIGFTYNLQSAVMTNIGATTTSQQAIVNQNLQFMFVNLDYAVGS